MHCFRVTVVAMNQKYWTVQFPVAAAPNKFPGKLRQIGAVHNLSCCLIKKPIQQCICSTSVTKIP